ncbi:MAG: VIT and VWA domain-containing protein, partial [Deltaproteobacteria bacterium]|nr:VIT and VWA domain-containing protein [Deltaproteobacteria bacterium]
MPNPSPSSPLPPVPSALRHRGTLRAASALALQFAFAFASFAIPLAIALALVGVPAPCAAAAFALAASFAALAASPSRALASERGGPRPGAPPSAGLPYSVSSVELAVDLSGQMATAVLKTRFKNLSARDIEIDYLAPLPGGASVASAVLVEENMELAGKVYARDEAFRIYSQIVAELKDPALIEYAGRDTYRARIFPVPPLKERTLELSMSFLVPKERGLCALCVPLAGPATGGGPVGRQEVLVRFRDTPGLSNVYSPLDKVEIVRTGSGGYARFESEGRGALDFFRLFYRSGSDGLAASLISHMPADGGDGFFLFLAEPAVDEGAPPFPKDVCFVLDISGSMSGNKFRQASDALRFVLSRLSPEDRFGLVHFNDETGRWKEALEPMTPESRADAEGYLSLLRPSGCTDMGSPLAMALEMMDGSRPGYVLFLTDGEANKGVATEPGLAGILKDRNASGARVFSFGVGHDLNARLLERFSSISGGTTVFVAEDEDIEAKVSEFFARLTSPVLTSPELKCSSPLNRVSPKRLPDLFSGGQISVVGRYPAGGMADFELSGQTGGVRKSFAYPFELSGGPAPEAAFLRTLWATRRSAQILDELDLSELSGEAGAMLRKELTGELVALA